MTDGVCLVLWVIDDVVPDFKPLKCGFLCIEEHGVAILVLFDILREKNIIGASSVCVCVCVCVCVDESVDTWLMLCVCVCVCVCVHAHTRHHNDKCFTQVSSSFSPPWSSPSSSSTSALFLSFLGHSV